MFPIFDSSVLTDFEKYEKITWLPLMWTYVTIQFWVPIFKLFYPELLYCTVVNEGEINYSMEKFFFDFMPDFKNLGHFMERNHIFDKNLKKYGHF